VNLARGHSIVSPTSRVYRAMALFRLGQVARAREVMADAEAEMTPPPADEKKLQMDEVNPDELILWMAYKEARALIK
jgi:hypothetical protein